MTAPRWQDERHPDHYHWMTSRLDARGARVLTCRLIATWMLVGGWAPTLIAFGITPLWAPRIIGLGVTAVSALLSLFWVRGRWPTRRQSATCVVIGTALAAAICLSLPSALVGLMGCGVFTAIATVAAVLHSWRLIVPVVATAAATITITGVRAAAADPSVALGFAITIALVIVFVTFVVRALIGLIDADLFVGAIEPVTGLLSVEGFTDGVGALTGARARSDDRHLVVMIVSLDSFGAVTDLSGAGRARELRVLVGQVLRETGRRDAVIAHEPDAEFLIADVFDAPDPSPLCDRISAGIRSTAPELTTSIGAVVTPIAPLVGEPPEHLTSRLLTLAEDAVASARGAGGNERRIVFVPDVPAADDEPVATEE